MHKINILLSKSSELHTIARNVSAHQQLQQFWLAAVPKVVANNSFASKLNNNQLIVYADSAIVANKIKLIQASLLTQLENLHKNNPKFKDYKVSAIVVKVRVKSTSITITKPPRVLSAKAASCLNNLATNLGESTLAAKLNKLASKYIKSI